VETRLDRQAPDRQTDAHCRQSLYYTAVSEYNRTQLSRSMSGRWFCFLRCKVGLRTAKFIWCCVLHNC